MPFERMEHRDITPERNPPRKETKERTHSSLFFDLMEETLQNFDNAQKEKPEATKSPLRNIAFFFKKSWDNFTEPLLEFDDKLADIMMKQWESKGAKSRALNQLKLDKNLAIEKMKVLVPDFERMDAARQRKALAKVYHGFTDFIHEKGKKFEEIAEDAGPGFTGHLQTLLLPFQDKTVAEEMQRLVQKKQRKEEQGEPPVSVKEGG